MPPLLTGQVSSYSPISESNPPDDCICRVKCVLVGDGAVGKTSLIKGYTTNAYPREYMPTAYDKYSVVVNINDKPVRLQICDTAGQDDFDALRPLCYPQTDVFLLCFSVVYPTSFYNIAEKWTYEIRHHCPKVPIVLVGTQSDLRTDIGVLVDLANYREQPVSVQEAKALAAKIGAVSYIECSAITRRNLKEVFDTALVSALKLRRPELVYPRTYADHQSKSVVHHNGKYFDPEDIRNKKRGWKKLWCFS